MKVSITTQNAFIVACYIAQRKDKGLIRSQVFSKQYNIPWVYMMKMMLQLVKANILQSKRGPQGGYSLARPASKITMLDIVEAAEGPMNMVSHMDECTKKDKFCKNTEQVYKKATDKIKNALKQVKLSDLL